MKIIHRIIAIIYAANYACMAGEWAVYYAYRERGYCAVGGECFLPPIVFILVYKIMTLLFKRMEEDKSDYQKR